MSNTNDSTPVVYKLPQALSEIMDEMLKNLELEDTKQLKLESK
jgi:hypothetical protein